MQYKLELLIAGQTEDLRDLIGKPFAAFYSLDSSNNSNLYFFFIYIVAASSQFLPDALQKWHEATKLLEHNQTTVNNKLLEIQYRIENFEKEVHIQCTLRH